MNISRNFGGVIWTDHALERLRERNISQGDAWVAFSRSDQSRYAKSEDAWIYNKLINGSKIEVVAKKNESGEWIILSVWSKLEYWSKEYRQTKKQSWFVRLLRKIFFADYR